MAVRGRAAAVVAADTDTPILAELTGKEWKITRILISNNGAGVTRVRIWDVFTETDDTVHNTTTNPVLLEDRNLQGDETVEILDSEGIVTAIGAVTAQATVAAAFPNDVIVGVWAQAE